ncbi:MAG: hypothetical protein V2A66_06070 [Pseudomonadota bacterium]
MCYRDASRRSWLSARHIIWRLVRYVHLNQVRAGVVPNVDEYRYSGHAALIDRTTAQRWREWYDCDNDVVC